MLRTLILLVVLSTFLVPSGPAYAVQPDEVLKDPALEKRARDISLELRCLVCQNQSIDDSDAPLARDLRLLVRDRLTAGDTNEQVVDFIVARYGEFVLLRPRFAAHTLVLWLAPLVLFLAGIFAMVRYFRRRPANVSSPARTKLTAKEKRELNSLLKKS